ncbi:MAG: helicase, partial [Weeksellaceae bacterium]|nr:helicase [Weeksellaceae bacterium]
MNNYVNEPRLIFRDSIQNNLIGPGSDVFVSNSENEIISDYPLSRYYSGILFPERDIDELKKDSIGKNADANANAETEDDNKDVPPPPENNSMEDENDNDYNNTAKPPKSEDDKDYSEANQYFPTNFGLTFCVPKDAKTLTVTFNYAKYIQ